MDNEVLGFPNSTSYEGGYDIICTLRIDVGCYHVKCESYYSATGVLYKFSNMLKECYQNLEGQAEHHLLLENDLEFTVSMTSSGHAVVIGTFQEKPNKDNILSFEIESQLKALANTIRFFQMTVYLKVSMNNIDCGRQHKTNQSITK